MCQVATGGNWIGGQIVVGAALAYGKVLLPGVFVNS